MHITIKLDIMRRLMPRPSAPPEGRFFVPKRDVDVVLFVLYIVSMMTPTMKRQRLQTIHDILRELRESESELLSKLRRCRLAIEVYEAEGVKLTRELEIEGD